MTSAAKAVFVMVTAETCGACKKLHSDWSSIRKAIENLGAVRIIEIKLPEMGSKVSDQRDSKTKKPYPNDLQRYVLWYPTGFLFTGKNWDNVMDGRESTLDGVIFNGIVGNPQPQQGYSLTDDGLTSWIKDTLRENSKFSLEAAEKSSSPRDPRSSLYARVQNEKMYIPTSGSAEICRKMKLKPKNRF